MTTSWDIYSMKNISNKFKTQNPTTSTSVSFFFLPPPPPPPSSESVSFIFSYDVINIFLEVVGFD